MTNHAGLPSHTSATRTRTGPVRPVVVTVEGTDKHDPIQRIRAGEDLPGARIRSERVIWLGDAAALG